MSEVISRSDAGELENIPFSSCCDVLALKHTDDDQKRHNNEENANLHFSSCCDVLEIKHAADEERHNNEENSGLKKRHKVDLFDNRVFLTIGDERIQITTESNGTIDDATAKRLINASVQLFEVERLWRREYLKRKPALRKCDHCGCYFLGAFSARSCSASCAHILAMQKQREKRTAFRERMARHLRIACVICKKPIESKRASKMFCSSNCRHKARRRWGNSR